MEKTSFSYFCDLLIDDIKERMEQDANGDKCFGLGQRLIQIIHETQGFYGHDAPIDDAELIADIQGFEPMTPQHKDRVNVVKVSPKTLAMLRADLLKTATMVLLLFLPLLSWSQNDALGYVARVETAYKNATELKVITPQNPVEFGPDLVLVGAGDTVRVGLRLSCKEPQYIWNCYRVRVRLSSTATAFKYLGPDKKPLPKGCQILGIIWPNRNASDIIPE